MSKPWEERWTRDGRWVAYKRTGDSGTVANFDWNYDRESSEVLSEVDEARAVLAAAAPDMTRVGLAVVNDVVANFAPNVGPMTADDIIGTGLETVEIPMRQFAAMVAALRKAGAL